MNDIDPQPRSAYQPGPRVCVCGRRMIRVPQAPEFFLCLTCDQPTNIPKLTTTKEPE